MDLHTKSRPSASTGAQTQFSLSIFAEKHIVSVYEGDTCVARWRAGETPNKQFSIWGNRLRLEVGTDKDGSLNFRVVEALSGKELLTAPRHGHTGESRLELKKAGGSKHGS